MPQPRYWLKMNSRWQHATTGTATALSTIMPMAARLWLLAGLVSVLATLPCRARTWTDVDGRKIEAELLEPGKSEVTLQLANGKTAKVPVAG